MTVLSDAALSEVQLALSSALRRESIGSRALLPFDPAVRLDVRAWLAEKLHFDHRGRYKGPEGEVKWKLIKDGLSRARVGRRHVPHCGKELILPSPDVDVGEIAARPSPVNPTEVLDWFAAGCARAAAAMVLAADNP